MADIRIISIDESKSKPANSNPYYVLALSDKPDQNWKMGLEDVVQKGKNSQIMNLKVDQSTGKHLTFTTPKGADLEQAINTIRGWLKELASEEDQIHNKIMEVTTQPDKTGAIGCPAKTLLSTVKTL